VVVWKAEIILTDGTKIELISGTRIMARMFEATETAVFEGEFDTVGLPFSQLKSFHIYFIGGLN
jgi:hypothetical protein